MWSRVAHFIHVLIHLLFLIYNLWLQILLILFILIEITHVYNCAPSLVLFILDICVVEVLKLILHLKTRFPVLLINIVCRLIFLQWLFRFAKIIENIFYLCKLFLHWRLLYIRDRRFRLNKLSALKFTVKNYRTLIINLKLISLCILIDLCWTSIINVISIFLI